MTAEAILEEFHKLNHVRDGNRSFFDRAFYVSI